MIVVTAQMWPAGREEQSYELLHATIWNTTIGEPDPDSSYMSRVIARPWSVPGYEASVEVRGFNRRQGSAALIAGVLETSQGSNSRCDRAGNFRRLQHMDVHELTEFERLVRANRGR